MIEFSAITDSSKTTKAIESSDDDKLCDDDNLYNEKPNEIHTNIKFNSTSFDGDNEKINKYKQRQQKHRGRRKIIKKKLTTIDNLNFEQIPNKYKSSDNIHLNTNVRKAILWIKIDANKLKVNQSTNQRRRKQSVKRKSFTLWVFQIAEPYCKRKNVTKSVSINHIAVIKLFTEFHRNKCVAIRLT